MAQPAIQTSFAAGELAPKLRSRVDIAKYHHGAQIMRNMFVDYSGGGASTRQGTKFIGQVGASGARLIPFQPSVNLSYALEFGNGYIRFFSNGAQIISSGVPYQIASPYAASDLYPNPITGNPGIKYVQDVTSLIICHPSYAPQILTIVSPTNWTLSAINFGATINTPTNPTLVSNLGAGSFSYGYEVTAVDSNGQESAPTIPVTLGSLANIQSSNGTNTFSWTAVPGAQSYNVYKASPTYLVTIASGSQYGFIGNVTGTTFTDTTPGVAPNFALTPPVVQNPFFGASVASYTVTASGTYTAVPIVTVGGTGGATAIASLGIISSVLVFPGTGFTVGNIYNIIDQSAGGLGVVGTLSPLTVDNNGRILTYNIIYAGSITTGNTPPNNLVVGGGTSTSVARISATWGVTQVISISGGEGYTTAPPVTFSTGAAAATAVLGMTSSGNPGVPGFIQERLVLAGQQRAVQSFNMSQPGSFFNFNVSNPIEDDDAVSGNIIAEDLNAIRSLIAVPTGILALTNRAGWLLNGGGGISTMNPITPANIVAQPQAYNGANDLKPIKINNDILYGTVKGNYIRDLSYNIYMQIFTGADISTLSNHLFFGYYLVDWAWAEEPFKTLWTVRNDGTLLSLGFVKEQELMGWAHHDTSGQFKSVCSVIETDQLGNVVDAIYVIVERTINGSVVQNVERMADRFFPYGAESSWSVDCGLQTTPNSTQNGQLIISGNASAIGNVVTLTDVTDAPFTAPMVGWVVRAAGGIYTITAFNSASSVTAQVKRVTPNLNPYTNTAYNVNTFYTIWQPVTSVSGLTQLLNTPVVGLADGTPISGTVDGFGNLALGGTFTKVTVGLQFTPQLQTLPLDLGQPTVQGKRKKITGITLRVADTLGLSIGKTFNTLVSMKDFTIGNVPTTSSGVANVTDLVNGDGRTIIDQEWESAGNYCVQQNLPYPATILAVMPEVTVGDTPTGK